MHTHIYTQTLRNTYIGLDVAVALGRKDMVYLYAAICNIMVSSACFYFLWASHCSFCILHIFTKITICVRVVYSINLKYLRAF